MFFKAIVFILVATVVTGCAGGHVGVAPNGRAYGQMSIPPAAGYGYAPQRQQVLQHNQMIVMQQQSYRQPRFSSNYHNHQYGYSGALVQQCKVNIMTRQRVCQMMPPYMVNRW